MNQDELYQEIVTVPVFMNNQEETILLDGPFHDFGELFFEIERMEMSKNKQNPHREDQIDLVKLGSKLMVPMIHWSFF